MERSVSVADSAADIQSRQITHVIGMQMTDEHLVEIVVRNFKAAKIGNTAGSNVEQKLVAIAQFN